MNSFDSKYFDIVNFDEKIMKLVNFNDLEYVKPIFGYIVNYSFLHVMSYSNAGEISGKMILDENPWITVNEFLKKSSWESDIESTGLTISITQLFYIFVTQGYMEFKIENGKELFNLIQSPEAFPKDLINKLQKKHHYLLYVLSDLMSYLSNYIKSGKLVLDRDSNTLSLLWESMYQDPLFYRFVKENISWEKHQFAESKKNNTLTIANLTVGSGIETIDIINKLIKTNDNMKIIVYCFDTSPVLLKRAIDNLTTFKRQISFELHEKNIELKINFSQISFAESIGMADFSLDLLIANYIFHFLSNDQRENFFKQIASLLKNNGIFLMSQIVSISNTIPHPITPLFLPFKNFNGIPVISDVKETAKKYFKDVKEHHMSFNWRFRKPRK